MNWLFSIFFLIFTCSQYSVIGERLLSFSKFEYSFGKQFILGFLGTFLIMYFVGIPCQIFHVSWNLYYVIMLVTFLTIDGLLVIKYNSIYLCKVKVFKNKLNRQGFLSFIKNNWVFILFVLLFTSFSMANQLPVYQLNYDDYYYIGKIVNLVGADHIFNENYFNGAEFAVQNFDLFRYLNTYELSYGFFSSIFHIDIPFFCRGTMVLHNYILFAVVYKELAKVMVCEKYAQFAIAPFFLFLIPLGYLQPNLGLQIYDLWQFQTASFYGGSVVRMLSLPVLILFSLPLIKKLEIRKIIMMAVICLSFSSFSMIFIQVFLLFIPLILITKFLYFFMDGFKNKERNKMILYGLLILFIVFGFIFTKYLDHFSFINTNQFKESIGGFRSFIEVWYKNDKKI